MSGLISQLQADAIDGSVSTTTLLRKVKLAAVKLGLNDTLEWVDAELEGYEKEVPSYRRVSGQLKWFNPVRGYLPVGFPNDEMAESFQNWPINESVPSLESTLGSSEGTFALPMPAAVTTVLTKAFGVPVSEALLDVSRGSLVGIIEHVRGLVLNWSLELERAGITGEGLSFSVKEQQIAKSSHVSIGTFLGSFNTGEISGTNARVNQGSSDSSSNISVDRSVFGELEIAITAGVNDKHDRDALLRDLQELQSAKTAEAKLTAYRALLSDAANYMTILVPFLPALTALLSQRITVAVELTVH